MNGETLVAFAIAIQNKCLKALRHNCIMSLRPFKSDTMSRMITAASNSSVPQLVLCQLAILV